MTTSFSIISSITVPENYSWDSGVPFSTEALQASAAFDPDLGYIVGYAPGVRIAFQNTSTEDIGYDYTEYSWDFNDYYNTTYNNVTLSCLQNVSHTYIMPGIYKVTLKHVQTKTVPLLVDPGVPALSCLGKYDIEWYWDNLSATKICRTWFETTCDGSFSKTWDDELACYGKYCKFWSWTQLELQGGVNPVTWEQSKTDNIFTKRWQFEPPTEVCTSGQDATFVNVLQVQENKFIPPTFTVKVLEIMPVANIYTITQPTTGISPLTVQITPRETKCGSFPIDKILWDPGDGSPILTVSRLQEPNLSQFTYTNYFSADPLDPRNYDLIHTYKRGLKTYPMFYPSLTAYSGSTNSSDMCSTVIGPVALPSISGQTHLLKIRNNTIGNLYSLQSQNYITFVTTQTAISDVGFSITKPQNLIKPVTPLTTQVSYGNNGFGYPELETFVC